MILIYKMFSFKWASCFVETERSQLATRVEMPIWHKTPTEIVKAPTHVKENHLV